MRKIFFIILMGICVVTGGCALLDSFHKNSNQNPNTPLTASSTIDINNPETWNTFEFKELGFSIKLPFEKDSVTSKFTECVPDKNTVCEVDHSYFSYLANLKTPSGGVRIGSVSQYFACGCEWSPWMIYDFYQSGKNYKFSPIGDESNSFLTIHPLKTFYVQGRLVVIYDLYKDFYGEVDRQHGGGDKKDVYGVVMKIQNKGIFKAVSMEFQKSNAINSVEQLEKIIQTTIF